MPGNKKGLERRAYILFILLLGIFLCVVLLARKCDFFKKVDRGIDKSGVKLDEINRKKTGIPPSIITRKFAMVIDDIGYGGDISPYLELGVPITFAIMPHERFSKKIALELAGMNVPFIMHLPLEPEGYPKVNPGKYALLVGMSRNEIEKMLDSDLSSVPGIKGVSNHMGSKFSADARKMSMLLNLLKKKNLFYFDSYTTPHSKAKKIAGEIGLPCKVNEIFVDLEDTPEYMRLQFDKIKKMVERNGGCIAIGHIQRKSLLRVLKEIIPEFKDKGIEFVYLETFMLRR